MSVRTSACCLVVMDDFGAMPDDEAIATAMPWQVGSKSYKDARAREDTWQKVASQLAISGRRSLLRNYILATTYNR